MSIHARTRDRNDGCKVVGTEDVNQNLPGSGEGVPMRLESMSTALALSSVQECEVHHHESLTQQQYICMSMNFPGTSGLFPMQHYRLRSVTLGILVKDGAMLVVAGGSGFTSIDLSGNTL